MRILFLIFVLALASGCAYLKRIPPGPAVTRAEVLQTAAAYANHPWQAGAANIFHGTDTNGARIDTPDAAWWGPGGWYADGRTNVGLPYCWNGDCTLAEFDAGIRAGRPAGDQFKKMPPRSQSYPGPLVSALPVGVDCSGFVSRCWELKERRSTYDMARVCRRLHSYDDLLPGDAVNKPYQHIILFAGWVDAQHKEMRVFEARAAGVHEGVYEAAVLEKMGFVPLRYKGMAD